MTNSSDNLHVYLREIKQGERTSLSVLASLVSEGAKVLDLGTGSGALGRYLGRQAHCTVDGVTINDAEAAVARDGYRRLEIADLDHCDLPALFAGERYDFIICADVLEHLKRPERVVEACRQLLSPDGQLLISVPNAAYCGLIGELLLGEFAYREEGLLDKTHLRFFTRRSLTRFLAELGWSPDSIDTIALDLVSSEFRAAFDSLPPAVARYLLAIPDALTYQLVAAVRPLRPGQVAPGLPPLSGQGSGQALFSAQLFLGENGGYAEDRKLVTKGVIGEPRQTLSFALPALPGPLTGLRLDLADRPGFVHLYRLCVRTADGSVLWQWRCDVDGFALLDAARHHEMLLRSPWPTAAAALILLHGDDPWLELPLPSEVLSACASRDGVAVDVEMGWPMSADYLALSDMVNPLYARISEVEQFAVQERGELERAAALEAARLREEAARQRHELEQAAARERSALEQAATRERNALEEVAARERSERERVASELQAVAEQNRFLAGQNKSLFEQKSNFVRETNALQSERLRLQQDRDGLIQHLQWIENSTVFRATRPLVQLKMRVDSVLAGFKPAGAPAQQEALAAPRPAPEALMSEPIDVIVPVYRGLDDTRCCIESVLASVCRVPFRLIVINDASPDPEVTAWLRGIDGRDQRLVLLENPENLGFVGTVNRGMALSDSHDVVLLNSDAEVANDWLDRLCLAAYSDRRVATVTPFSNNATICSYPRFCQDNELPAGHDTASLDALFAQTNPGAVVDVPTGVGFCMYIRRASLAEVGLFDTESFGKGYGEENDYCRRASAAGWRNLHALDTFARHAGGVSFGASKSPREQEAMEILRRLHPDYERVVHQFVAADPAYLYRQRVDLARVRQSGLPTVLAVVHDRSGGTVRHVTELAAHLQSQAVFFILKPSAGGHASLELAGSHEAFQLWFKLPDEFEDLVLVLRHLGMQHIHFHHLIGHAAQIRELPVRLGLSYDFTAHDFYTLCPQISLTDHTNGYCGEEGVDQCRTCLRRSPAPGGTDIETWRVNHAHFVSGARHVLVPSRDAARRFVGFVPTADVRLAPHTDILAPDTLPIPAPRRLPANAALKIVVIGALSSIKGADVLEDVAVEAARRGVPLEFHLIGYAYRSLRTQPRASLTVHGEYSDADLPGLLEWLKPDLVWFPAQWPETYSYTLSACLQAGMPVVAPDLGAFPERLSGRRWSWTQAWDTKPADWLAFFLRVRQDHFMTGQAPMPAWHAALAGVDTLIKPWSYAEDYLRGKAAPDEVPAISDAFLLAHHPKREEGGGGGAPQRVKQHLLLAIIRLRSARGLRSVAKAIPLRWQTRLKSWLRA